MKTAKRTTIQDIANRTGYSKTAVSFAFNSPERISKEAVEKILQVAMELDYIPDPMARNFSLGHHMALGFLLPQRVETTLRNPYMQQVIRGVAEVCQEHGYMLTLIPPLHSSVTEAVKNATVDGIITIGLLIDKNIRGVFRLRHLPLVSIDGSEDDDIHSVCIDDTAAAKLQLEKVLERGHREIAIISLPEDAYASHEQEADTVVRKRKKGYLEALSEYNVSPDSIIIESSDVTVDDGSKVAEKILDSYHPSCFICMADAVAIGVVNVLKQRGLDDISVIGFDGIIEDMASMPELTTIYQSGREKGLRSAEILFKLLNDEKPPLKTLIPYSYHEGETLKEALWK